jgi:hypothetical protein
MKILCLLTAVLLSCGASTASAACRPRPGDTDKFHDLVLGSFYAYDGGKRWEGDSLIEWHRRRGADADQLAGIGSAAASGQRLEAGFPAQHPHGGCAREITARSAIRLIPTAILSRVQPAPMKTGKLPPDRKDYIHIPPHFMILDAKTANESGLPLHDPDKDAANIVKHGLSYPL